MRAAFQKYEGKSNYDRLHIDKALGILKSDNINKNKNNVCSDSGPFWIQKGAGVTIKRPGKGQNSQSQFTKSYLQFIQTVCNVQIQPRLSSTRTHGRTRSDDRQVLMMT